MECKDFLEGYSSYRDDLLDEPEKEAFRAHLECCESCARYDRVVRKGTRVLRELPPVDPPSDFLARLRHRIYHLEDGIPLSSSFPGGSAALVAAAAAGLLALAWLPIATHAPVEVELHPVAVDAPEVRRTAAGRDLVDPGPFMRTRATVAETAESLPAWSDVRLLPVHDRSGAASAATVGAVPAFAGPSPGSAGAGR